jgi:hypothetical protein
MRWSAALLTRAEGERSVKPSAQPMAQPTLVRTQHLPPPATTCENGPLAANSRAGGPFLLCPAVCHLVSLRAAVSRCPGRIADAIRAPGRSVRTVGVSTDRHGRARPALRFRVGGAAGSACASHVRLGRVNPRTREGQEDGSLQSRSGSPNGTGGRHASAARPSKGGRAPAVSTLAESRPCSSWQRNRSLNSALIESSGRLTGNVARNIRFWAGVLG